MGQDDVVRWSLARRTTDVETIAAVPAGFNSVDHHIRGAVHHDAMALFACRVILAVRKDPRTHAPHYYIIFKNVDEPITRSEMTGIPERDATIQQQHRIPWNLQAAGNVVTRGDVDRPISVPQ